MKQLPILQVAMHKKANFPLCGEIGVFFLTTCQVQVQIYSVEFQNWFGRLLTKIFGFVWLATVDAQLSTLLAILDLADMIIFG